MRTPDLQDKPKAGRRVKHLERFKRCHGFVCVGESFPRGRATDRLRREIEEER